MQKLYWVTELFCKIWWQIDTFSEFISLSKIQNDLIEAVAESENNIKEIIQALFIAIEVDKTTDISCTVMFFSIEVHIGLWYQRSLYMTWHLKDRTVGGVTECMSNNLNKYDSHEKLIVQTYNEAIVMAFSLNGVQVKVWKTIPVALFTYCYAHKLILFLENFIFECTNFFKISEALASFSHHSTKWMSLLDEIVRKHIPKTAPMR